MGLVLSLCTKKVPDRKLRSNIYRLLSLQGSREVHERRLWCRFGYFIVNEQHVSER